jgi:hypothetical protein
LFPSRAVLALPLSLAPMRSPRVSEGKCPTYGIITNNPTETMAMWRARLHNEKAGMPGADFTGANTSISLVWNPARSVSATAKYDMSSHRRMSSLKVVQDFGLPKQNVGERKPPTPEPALPTHSSLPPLPSMHPPLPSMSPLSRDVAAAAFANAPRPAPPAGATLRGRPTMPANFFDAETARLRASARAREIGNTFLRGGNLQQAKAYLARAEQLLQIDPQQQSSSTDLVKAELDAFMKAG